MSSETITTIVLAPAVETAKPANLPFKTTIYKAKTTSLIAICLTKMFFTTLSGSITKSDDHSHESTTKSLASPVSRKESPCTALVAQQLTYLVGEDHTGALCVQGL